MSCRDFHHLQEYQDKSPVVGNRRHGPVIRYLEMWHINTGLRSWIFGQWLVAYSVPSHYLNYSWSTFISSWWICLNRMISWFLKVESCLTVNWGVNLEAILDYYAGTPASLSSHCQSLEDRVPVDKFTDALHSVKFEWEDMYSRVPLSYQSPLYFPISSELMKMIGYQYE